MKPSCAMVCEANKDPVWTVPPQVMQKKAHYRATIWREFLEDGNTVRLVFDVRSKPTSKKKFKTMYYSEFCTKFLNPAVEELMPEGQEFVRWGFSVYPWN